MMTLQDHAVAETVIVHGAGSSYAATDDQELAPDRVIRHFPPEALRTLVAPIALYPDDLLALVLAAAAHPQQIAEAARFLETMNTAAQAAPDPAWDPAVIALLNYPEVLARMSADLNWTREIGAAAGNQEAALVAAIAAYRQAVYAAGNLQTDHRLRMDRDRGVIRIRPAHPQVLYVPYYDTSRVLVRQADRVYHFHPRPYPVYYYPYASGFPFATDLFWGVRSHYEIGWQSRQLILSRPPVESLHYRAGTPPGHGDRLYRPPIPAYAAPRARPSERIAANPRHPGRDLAGNPRHPGRDLAINGRHPGRLFAGGDYRGDHRGHQSPRAPAAAAGRPEDGAGAPAEIRKGRVPYAAGAATQSLRANSGRGGGTGRLEPVQR